MDQTFNQGHRLAFPAARLYYDAQIESKRYRRLVTEGTVEAAWDKQYSKGHKGRKEHYRGKPTRWYARLMKLERQADAMPPPT